MMSSITMTDDAASDPSFAFQGHPLIVTRGHPLPLGACVTPNGVNFALICRHGTAISLILSEHCSAEIAAEIPLNSVWHRTGNHWHIRVAGLPDEFCYGYRVDGPKGVGHLYDPSIILLDPASRACRAAGPGACRGTSPAAAWSTRGARPPRSRAPAASTRGASCARTRSSTSCTSAGTPWTPRPACGTRAPTPAWSRRSPT